MLMYGSRLDLDNALVGLHMIVQRVRCFWWPIALARGGVSLALALIETATSQVPYDQPSRPALAKELLLLLLPSRPPPPPTGKTQEKKIRPRPLLASHIPPLPHRIIIIIIITTPGISAKQHIYHYFITSTLLLLPPSRSSLLRAHIYIHTRDQPVACLPACQLLPHFALSRRTLPHPPA